MDIGLPAMHKNVKLQRGPDWMPLPCWLDEQWSSLLTVLCCRMPCFAVTCCAALCCRLAQSACEQLQPHAANLHKLDTKCLVHLQAQATSSVHNVTASLKELFSDTLNDLNLTVCERVAVCAQSLDDFTLDAFTHTTVTCR